MPFQLSDLHLKEDATRPVMTALSLACLENFNAADASQNNALFVAGQRATLAPGEAERRVMQLMESMLCSLKTAAELMNWVYPPGRPMPFAEAFGQARGLRDLGADSDTVQAILRGLQKRPPGRPHLRQTFVRAFEFMLQSKKNTQGRATRHFCPCGSNAHTVKCEHNLKAGMRSLKRVLRQHAPELVSRYETLHPDRAKKSMAKKPL